MFEDLSNTEYEAPFVFCFHLVLLELSLIEATQLGEYVGGELVDFLVDHLVTVLAETARVNPTRLDHTLDLRLGPGNAVQYWRQGGHIATEN